MAFQAACAGVLFLFWCFLLFSATSFNLEPRIPVIKYGASGSYFGFSVAEHITFNSDGTNTSWSDTEYSATKRDAKGAKKQKRNEFYESDEDGANTSGIRHKPTTSNKQVKTSEKIQPAEQHESDEDIAPKKMLIGAPLGQNLQPNTSRSGALWKCGLTPAVRDCSQVVTDGKTRSEDAALSNPHPEEIKNGQWLGVSVRSQGPGMKAVVCAHRYIRKVLESQYGQGLCYTLTNDLKLQDAWEPCRGRSVQREHEEFGFCQIGTSSSFLKDDTLVMGSPGPYTWRGTMFVSDTNDDLLERDNMVYFAPVEDGQSPVEKYSYLGMSVIGANFFGTKFSYAAGAPRAHGTGQVVIFSKREIKSWSADVNLLGLNLIINGEQFGSSFGYEVSAADVNGDGLPDLLVGAPFYFSKDVGGAVYLYLNQNNNFTSQYNVKLTGKQESQFGISIANAGDLNKDGCEDVAIGSPYEGNGVVYIHMGHRKNGLNTKPDQIIKAEDLPRHMGTFGYSLSGGLDLDDNGYPDLLVGAYENSSVALLRTRPIIDIKTWVVPAKILNIDPAEQGCEKDPLSNYTCFHFQACSVIKSLVKSTLSTIHKLNYVIEAETFNKEKKFSRIFFDSEKTSIVNKSISLGKNVDYCTDHIAYLKNNTRDIQTPIKIQLTFKLQHVQATYSTVGTLPNIDDYPVLNATATTTFTANFLNDCGEDGICHSDLVADPTLLLPKADDGTSYSLTLGEEEEVKLAVKVDNNGDSAYEAQLFVQHSPSLHYIAANISDKHVICTSVNKTTVGCLLENPFKRQPEGTPAIILRFDARALEDSDLEVEFSVWANSTSKEIYPGKTPAKVKAIVIKNADLMIHGVARPEQVFYGGEVKGESAMTYFDDIGPAIVHKYQISNEGRWRVNAVQVLISWPHQVASDKPQGKWLLYLENITAIDEETGHSHGKCFTSDEQLNPLKLTTRPGSTEPLLENLKMEPLLSSRSGKLSARSSSKRYNESRKAFTYSSGENRVRRRRDTEDLLKAAAYTDDGQRKHVEHMSCEKKTAKCIMFQCIIYPLSRRQEVTVTLQARLWNATLVEDFPRVGHVTIASHAAILIPDHYNIHQTGTFDTEATVETIAYPDLKISEPTEVPLWVIIISVIIGLIVLVLLIIFLWKLGFFKRSRPDPTLSGNLEKNNHEASPFIDRNRNGNR